KTAGVLAKLLLDRLDKEDVGVLVKLLNGEISADMSPHSEDPEHTLLLGANRDPEFLAGMRKWAAENRKNAAALDALPPKIRRQALDAIARVESDRADRRRQSAARIGHLVDRISVSPGQAY